MTGRDQPPRGFTLIELLVSMTILVLLMVMIFAVISALGKTWKTTTDKIEAFQDSRAAFDLMTRTLGQATLNNYYDYFDSTGQSPQQYNPPNPNFVPARYGRQSELHFICGRDAAGNPLLPSSGGKPANTLHAVFFQTPAGETGTAYKPLHDLLNACGYYVQFGSDAADSSLSGRPKFLDTENVPLRYRSRLMQLSQPSENLKIYDPAKAGLPDWFRDPLQKSTPPFARVLAENVVALIILPKKPDWEEKADDTAGVARIGVNYSYDSRTAWTGNTAQPVSMNQLPPLLSVTMVSIDEPSATRLQGSSVSPPDFGLNPTAFMVAKNFDADLAQFQTSLVAKRLNYRVFQAEIALRGSKWSQK